MSKPPKPSQVFANRMREVRTRRNWSMRQLSERLEELGVKLNTSQIAKIETGVRDISLDEALAISLALGVSPLNLFVPLDKEQSLSLAPTAVHLPTVARAWVRGTLPLPVSKDDVLFITEAPLEEVRARTNPRMFHLELVYFALLDTGIDIEAAEQLLLKWDPQISETLEAVKPLIQKGQAERMEQVEEWAQNDPELIRRIAADLLRKLRPQAQKGEAE